MIGNGSESGNDRDEVEAGHGSRVRWEVEGGRVRVQVQRQQGGGDGQLLEQEQAKEVASSSNSSSVNRGGSESSEEEVQTTSTCIDQNCNGTDCDTDTTTGYNSSRAARAGHALLNTSSTFDARPNVSVSVAARDAGRGTSSASSHVDTATGSPTPSLDDVAELIALDPEVIGAVQRALASLLFGPAKDNSDCAASAALDTPLERAGNAVSNNEDCGSGLERAGHQDEDRKPAARQAGTTSRILSSSLSPSDGPDAVATNSLRPGAAAVTRRVVRTVLLTDEQVARLLEEREVLMGGDRSAARDVGVVCASCACGRRYEHHSGPRPLAEGAASLAEADLTPSGTDDDAVGQARVGTRRAGRMRQRVVTTSGVAADYRTHATNCDAAVATSTSAKPSLVSTSTAPPPVKSVSFSSVSAPHFDMDDDEEDEEDRHNGRYSYGQSQLIPSRQADVPRNPYHEYEDEDGGDLHQDDANYPFDRRFNQDEYETARRERHQYRHFHRRNRRIAPNRALSASPPTSSFSTLVAQGGSGDETQRMIRGRTRGRSHSPSGAHIAAESFVPFVTEGHSAPTTGARTCPHQDERRRREPSFTSASWDLSHTEAVNAGETTASGDSSVASGHQHHGSDRSSSAISATAPQVHFSAMNPNPQLVLDPHNQSQTFSNDQQQGHIPIVRFTVDRAVSFEDELLSNNNNTNTSNTASGGSRASRSGLSSPSIEPALSPPRSRSRSPLQIQFDDSAITTITEAAARLRRGQQMYPDRADDAATHGSGATSADGDSSQRPTIGTLARPSPRVVHFSAMRDVTVVDVDASAASSLNSAPPASVSTAVMDGSSSAGTPSTTASTANNASSNDLGETGFTGSSRHSHNTVVHFAESTSAQFRPIPFPGSVSSNHHTEAEMGAVAERLRRLIRRAEQINNVTLEVAFAHFDQDHSGTITPRDLQIGLRTLGESFCFSLEECSALLECLSGRGRQSGRCNATDNGVARSGIYDWEEGGNAPRQEPGINLLGFYRAMGRRSPPPIDVEGWPGDRGLTGNGDEDDEYDDGGGLSATMSRRRGAAHLARVQMDLASSPVVHAHDAASRLRDIILEAEQNDGMPLESSFRLLDPAGSGYITASDFHRGLLELGRGRTRRSNEYQVRGGTELTVEGNEEGEGGINAFARINDDDCEELVALFDTNGDGLVSLLDFYIFMGRRSPPLRSEGELTDDGGSDRDDGSDEI